MKSTIFAVLLAGSSASLWATDYTQPYITIFCKGNFFEITETIPQGALGTNPKYVNVAEPAAWAKQPCTYQFLKGAGYSEGKDYNVSDTVTKVFGVTGKVVGAGSGNSVAQTGQASSGYSRVDTFPWRVPLPFSPPTAIPAQATSAACDASMKFYAVDHDAASVYVYTICPPANPTTLHPCDEPLEQALTPDGTTLMVTCYDNKVVWINTATDTISFTLPITAFAAGIAISPDGTRAYVTNYNDVNPSPSILVIDVVNHLVLQTYPLLNAFPGVITLTPDGSQAWVNYYANNLVDVIDTATGTLNGRVSMLYDTENGIVFNSTGTKAFIAVGGANQLAIVDTKTLQVLARIPVIDQPATVIFNPDNQTVIVESSTTGDLSLVDGIGNVLVANYPAATMAGGIGASLLLGNIAIPQQ